MNEYDDDEQEFRAFFSFANQIINHNHQNDDDHHYLILPEIIFIT